MEDRETARMRKYGESKTTRIMMATVPHVTSGLGLRKFQADGFLLTRVYHMIRSSLPVLHKHNSLYLLYLRHSGYVNHRTEKRGHSWCLTQVLVSVLRSIFNLRLCSTSLYLFIAVRSGSGCHGSVKRPFQWQPHPSEWDAGFEVLFLYLCLPDD